MNDSNRNERNGPALSVTIVTPAESPRSRCRRCSHRPTGGRTSSRTRPARARSHRWRRAGSPLVRRGNGVRTWTSSRGNRPVSRFRRRWSRTPRSPAARPSSDRSAPSRTPPCGVRPGCRFALVGRGQDQPLVPQQPQDHRLAVHMPVVPVVADHRPDLAMSPGRVRQRMPAGEFHRGASRRPRPRPPGMGAGTGPDPPTSPGPFGHVDQLAEPRGRHARLGTDHLEVLEGPGRPSADFFQIRISTAASPNAWVRSATSASSCSSRVEGPDLPAANAVFPASKKSTFPTTDRLLADLLSPCSLGDGDLTGNHAQHDPGLLLNRDPWWSSHVSDSSSGLTQSSCHKV